MWRGDKEYSKDTPGIDIYTRTHNHGLEVKKRQGLFLRYPRYRYIHLDSYTHGLDVERRQGLFLGYSRYIYIHLDSYSWVRCGEETMNIPRILQV